MGMPPVNWLYIRGMKARLLLVAVVAVAATGCGGGEKSQAAETTATASAPAYTWGQLRTDYTTLVLNCDLVMKGDTDVNRLSCLMQHNAAIKSARKTVDSLPVSKERSDLLVLFDGFQDAKSKFDDHLCSAGSTTIECTTALHLMTSYDTGISNLIAGQANAGK